MNLVRTEIADVIVIEPKVFGDERGFFYESFNNRVFQQHTGASLQFVQTNYSRSTRNVLRGLHYQIRQPQGKLVKVVIGEIFDVVVDIRKSSPTFGKWVGMNLSADNKRMLWVPEGFAHGFLVVSESAEMLYQTTDYYAPQHERSIAWNDPAIGIEWPLKGEPIVAAKDKAGQHLNRAEVFE